MTTRSLVDLIEKLDQWSFLLRGIAGRSKGDRQQIERLQKAVNDVYLDLLNEENRKP